MTSSHAIVGEKAWEQREDSVARGLHVSGLHKEADVLATNSVSSGEAETASRMSSRKVHYGPSGGYCFKKKKCPKGENNPVAERKKTQLGSNSSEGLLPQLEINTRHTRKGQKKAVRSQHLSSTTKTEETASRLRILLSPSFPSLPPPCWLFLGRFHLPFGHLSLPKFPATYPSPWSCCHFFHPCSPSLFFFFSNP